MTGASIREFFHDLFGSRLVANLELSLLQLRQDYESRLLDKELIIASLREDRATLTGKVALYETSLLPTTSRAGAEVVKMQRPTKPNFAPWDFNSPPVKSRWQALQEEHEKEMTDEIAREEAEKSKPAIAE